MRPAGALSKLLSVPHPAKQGAVRPAHRAPNGGHGRPKGAVNKSTASVKAALIAAFEQRGGVPALLAWAAKEPTEFYKLWAKMLPQEVTGKDGGPIQVTQLWKFGQKSVSF